MTSGAPLPPFAAIVVAAGKGLRAGGDRPKQFRFWRGKPVLEHSVQALLEAGANPLVIVAPSGMHAEARAASGVLEKAVIVDGGATRQASVRAGLEALCDDAPAAVLIHDVARPDLPRDVIEGLLAALELHPGAIPTLPVVDSLAVISEAGTMAGKAERETLRRVQTPQAFR
ncbi:MAG: IspD/TarI family cytidylyltransferase, partial [Pseudomonadota bacterium]